MNWSKQAGIFSISQDRLVEAGTSWRSAPHAQACEWWRRRSRAGTFCSNLPDHGPVRGEDAESERDSTEERIAL